MQPAKNICGKRMLGHVQNIIDHWKQPIKHFRAIFGCIWCVHVCTGQLAIFSGKSVKCTHPHIWQQVPCKGFVASRFSPPRTVQPPSFQPSPWQWLGNQRKRTTSMKSPEPSHAQSIQKMVSDGICKCLLNVYSILYLCRNGSVFFFFFGSFGSLKPGDFAAVVWGGRANTAGPAFRCWWMHPWP